MESEKEIREKESKRVGCQNAIREKESERVGCQNAVQGGVMHDSKAAVASAPSAGPDGTVKAPAVSHTWAPASEVKAAGLAAGAAPGPAAVASPAPGPAAATGSRRATAAAAVGTRGPAAVASPAPEPDTAEGPASQQWSPSPQSGLLLPMQL
jgi:hypothetical protein